MQQFEKLLKDKVVASSGTDAPDVAVTLKTKFIKVWTFYLRNGFLPWWATVQNAPGGIGASLSIELGIEQMSQRTFEEEEKQFFDEVLTNTIAVNRLVDQIKEPQFWVFLSLYTSAHKTILDSLREDIEVIISSSVHPFKNDVRTAIKAALLKTMKSYTSLTQLYQKWATTIVAIFKTESVEVDEVVVLTKLKTEVLMKTISVHYDKPGKLGRSMAQFINDEKLDKPQIMEEAAQTREKHTKEIKLAISEKEGIYIGNAGLVIVAQYMGRFFAQLGIADGAKINDLPRAVTILHYIVTGREDFEEYEVVLPKVLCGLEPADLIVPVELDEADILETTALLQAVIEHWSVLKSTSPEGLKGSFLQREGKLSFDDNTWSLKVQPQSYDLLLQHLPWNFSLIKLPWMPSLIKTEWI